MKPANECKCNVVVNRCADAGQQAVIEQLRAQLTAEQAKSKKLAGRVAMLHNFLDRFPASSGCCCCGEPMDSHSDPMSSGHSPVDSGDYAVCQMLTATQSDVEAYLAERDAKVLEEAASRCTSTSGKMTLLELASERKKK